MAGRIERVRPGLPAEQALVDEIARVQSSDPLAPVTVTVRSPMVALDLRRRLADRGAVAAVRFTPFARLVELLGAPEAGASLVSGRPLTPSLLDAAVRVALRTAPGVFAGVADHPSTAESLAASYRLLRPLGEPELDRLAGTSDRAAAVVAIVRRTRALVQGDHYDLDDLALAAARGLRDGEVDLASLGEVVVHLPDPLRPSQVELLGALAARTGVTVLCSHLGDPAADRSSDALAAALEAAGFARPQDEDRPAERPISFDRLLSPPDVDEEVRTVVRLLLAHGEAGGDLGRCLVAVPTGRAGEPYLALLAEQLDGAGLSWTGPAAGRLATTPEGRVVTDLVALLTDAAGGFERPRIIDWLSLPGQSVHASLFAPLDPGAGAVACLPAGQFDRCSRLAGVRGGASEWTGRLGSLARRLEDPEEAELGAALGCLRAVVEWLVAQARALERADGWRAAAAVLTAMAGHVLEPSERRDEITEALSELEQLEPIERLSPAGAPRALELTAGVAAALGRPVGSHGRFGAGPVVGPATALAGCRSELAVLVGATEGVLPARQPEDPLVTALERETAGVLTGRERYEERDRRTTLMLLAAADRAVATFPRVARGGSRPAYASRWLEGDLFHREPERVASFAASLRAVATGAVTPADGYDLELAVVAATAERGGRLAETFVAALDDLPARLAAEAERRGHGLNRFAGAVGPGAAGAAGLSSLMSPTRLEALAACPLRFFFERLARIEVLDPPERLHEMAPSDRGNLVHEILERFVRTTAIDRPFTGWGQAELDELRSIAAECFADFEHRGLTGKAAYFEMTKAQLLADLERYVVSESERLLASGERPVAVELAFGVPGGGPPVEVTAGGRTFSFRGRIDRVDESGEGLRVTDYKTGSTIPYARIEAEPLGGGRHLQLPIYAKAAAAARPGAGRVVAEYSFCTASSGFRTVAVELTRELEEELGDVLGVLAGTIEQGTFPPRPGREGAFGAENCRICDYQSVCRLDRAQRWEEAALTVELAEYVALVEEEAP